MIHAIILDKLKTVPIIYEMINECTFWVIRGTTRIVKDHFLLPPCSRVAFAVVRSGH